MGSWNRGPPFLGLARVFPENSKRRKIGGSSGGQGTLMFRSAFDIIRNMKVGAATPSLREKVQQG
jgi:hypothetical protein